MTFQPGVAANPNGRPKGSRNRRTQEILDLIQGRGDKDPLDALSEIVSTSENPDHRISASNILAPYLHSKRGTASAPRFLETPVEVPTFNTVQEAEAYLAHIPVLLGRGELDSQTALELSTLTKNWLDSIYARQDYEIKLQAQGGGSEQHITISGGLPPLSGCNIIGMGGEDAPAQLNGHNGHVIEHDAQVLNDLTPAPTESAPSEGQEP